MTEITTGSTGSSSDWSSLDSINRNNQGIVEFVKIEAVLLLGFDFYSMTKVIFASEITLVNHNKRRC